MSWSFARWPIIASALTCLLSVVAYSVAAPDATGVDGGLACFAALSPQPPSTAATTTVMSTADTVCDVRPTKHTLAGAAHASRRLMTTSAAANTTAVTAAKYTIDAPGPHGIA